MPKRKNRTPEDWGDESASGFTPDVEVSKVTLSDFVIQEKVSAFVRAYNPAPPELDDTSPYVESFDDSRLREFFKAYVCGLGDPLDLYIEDLKLAGFRMSVSLATGEPTIFAIRKPLS